MVKYWYEAKNIYCPAASFTTPKAVVKEVLLDLRTLQSCAWWGRGQQGQTLLVSDWLLSWWSGACQRQDCRESHKEIWDNVDTPEGAGRLQVLFLSISTTQTHWRFLTLHWAPVVPPGGAQTSEDVEPDRQAGKFELKPDHGLSGANWGCPLSRNNWFSGCNFKTSFVFKGQHISMCMDIQILLLTWTLVDFSYVSCHGFGVLGWTSCLATLGEASPLPSIQRLSGTSLKMPRNSTHTEYGNWNPISPIGYEWIDEGTWWNMKGYEQKMRH